MPRGSKVNQKGASFVAGVHPVDDLVAVDTETSGLYVDEGARVSVVSLAWQDDRDGAIQSLALPFDQGEFGKPGVTSSLFEEDPNLGVDAWDALLLWLAGKQLVMHNAIFDCQMLRAGLRVAGDGRDLLSAVVWDTQVAQWTIQPEHPSGLKPTAARLWGESERAEQYALKPYLDRKGVLRNRFDLVPWEVLAPYAAKDAEMTLRLARWQWEWLDLFDGGGALERQVAMEHDVMRVLARMAYRGIGYDVERSRIEAARARNKMMAIEQRLPFRRTPDGARTWFFKVNHALPHCTTPGGEPSVSACCVRSLIAQQIPFAQEFAQLQSTKHTITMYYEGWANGTGPDGRIRTDYKQDGAGTMRFSSRHINLQAIPHDNVAGIEGLPTPRELFCPREGTQLWEFDLGQAEARVGAMKAGCQTWLDMFAGGRDLHQETADALGVNRQIGKRANFALIYGVGWLTFKRDVEKQTGLKLTDAEAKRIVDEWRGLYPEFPRVTRRVERIASRRTPPYVVLHDGRRRVFREFERQELHKAFNSVIQGSIAQFVKRWMVTVDAMPAVEVLLQIHDSVVVEIAEWSDVEVVVAEVRERGAAMATEFFGTPMLVDAKRWMTLADESRSRDRVVA